MFVPALTIAGHTVLVPCASIVVDERKQRKTTVDDLAVARAEHLLDVDRIVQVDNCFAENCLLVRGPQAIKPVHANFLVFLRTPFPR